MPSLEGRRTRRGPLLTFFAANIIGATMFLRWHYVIADYWCEVVGGVPRAGSDARELALVAEDQLPRYDLDIEALDVVRRGLALWREAQRPCRTEEGT